MGLFASLRTLHLTVTSKYLGMHVEWIKTKNLPGGDLHTRVREVSIINPRRACTAWLR